MISYLICTMSNTDPHEQGCSNSLIVQLAKHPSPAQLRILQAASSDMRSDLVKFMFKCQAEWKPICIGPSRGLHFLTYATYMLQQYMQVSLEDCTV